MRRTSIPLIVLPVLFPGILTGQRPRTVTLGPPITAYAEEFSGIINARELGDGRVIVPDSKDNRVVVISPKGGPAVQISRIGKGPGEYGMAAAVLSIGGDSSILVDITTKRWLLFDGARIVATIAADAPSISALGSGLPMGVDTVGHVYSTKFLPGQGRPIGDSLALVRVSRALQSGRADRGGDRPPTIDTLATMRALTPRIGNVPPGPGGTFRFTMPTIGVADEAVPFPDGWVAIVRSSDYHVDWRAPNGGWTRGAPLPVVEVPMSDREKAAFVDREVSRNPRVQMTVASVTDWPRTLPPYKSPLRLHAAADGQLLIPRLPSADAPETRYDIVNRFGVLEGQLVLPPRERIVGFGKRAVFIAVADDDGIERIRKHQWPVK